VGVALRRPDRKARHLRDLGETDIEGVLQRDDLRLSGRQLGKATPELTPCLGRGQSRDGIAVAGLTLVGEQRLGATQRPGLGEVLAGVHGQPMQPGRELRLAPELADSNNQLGKRVLCSVASVLRIAQQVKREPLDARRMPLAERRERLLVAGLGASHENRIGELLVDERGVGSGIGADWTALREARLHGRRTLDGMALVPEVVIPWLRGSFGRPYLHAHEAPSTMTMPASDAVHGTVALAEHQTAGRGRLGRIWVDEAGSGLALSVVLRPPPPVARWPELTLVAAEAVAAAIGEGATIKQPNDVLLDGHKVAGILAEAGDHVVVGIGVNVGEAPWPDAGFVERDRLELLVEILERLERGYELWVSDRS